MKRLVLIIITSLTLSACATSHYALKAPCNPYQCKRIPVNSWAKA